MNKQKGEVTKNSIDQIMESMIQEFGRGVVTTLGDNKIEGEKTFSTGSLLLDEAIGGGYVFGRMIEIFGEESSGKTTLALHAVRECQKIGKRAAYIDLEHCVDADYSKKIGVNVDELLVFYPSCGEQALEMVSKLIKEGINLIVVDSVAALIPKAELEADLEKQTIGLRARIMSSGLSKINSNLAGQNSTVIFINQIRNKISTGYFSGNPETTAGGVALSFYASLRMRTKRKERIEKGDECIGIKTLVKVNKNKLASPYKEALLEIIFGRGIEKSREIIDLAINAGIIQKSGNWYSYGEKKIGNGKENVSEYLSKNKEIYQEIEAKLLGKKDN